MDPIAHTLVGATLSQTGLRKLTPLATATLVIGANLPDIDGVMSFWGADASLEYRRGITHGILAQAIFPFILTGGILAFDRLIRSRRQPASQRVQALQVFLLACIAVVSHPFLDWLNTYGVRLLMPFSGRWFYGDTLYIVDAWMWLLMAAAAVFAYSHTKWSQMLWSALAFAASWLVSTAAFVPTAARIVWWLGVAGILVLRLRGVSVSRNRKVALGCMTAFALYIGVLSAGSHHVKGKVKAWLWETHGEEIQDAMIGPLPAQPFARDVIAVSSTHYHGLRVSVFEGTIEERYAPVPLPRPSPVIQRALQNQDIQGFVHWMRFPVYEVEPIDSGYRVKIRDLRYASPDQEEGRGIGMATTLVTHAMLQGEAAP